MPSDINQARKAGNLAFATKLRHILLWCVHPLIRGPSQSSAWPPRACTRPKWSPCRAAAAMDDLFADRMRQQFSCGQRTLCNGGTHFLQLVRKNCFFYDWHWTDGWGGGSFGVGVHHTPEHQHVCHVATYIEVQQQYNNAMEQWRIAAEAEEKLAERH